MLRSDDRPNNIEKIDLLLKFQWTLQMAVSIVHRGSGLLLFFAIPVFLYMLSESLASEERFDETVALLQLPLLKLIIWALLSALIYHFVAGMKHLLMDAGVGETLEGAKLGSILVLVLSGIGILGAGYFVYF